MLALSILAACTNNISEPEFYPEGGERSSSDGGTDPGDTTGDDTGSTLTDGAPVVTDAACYFEDSDAGTVILCQISYDDAEDDLVGGTAYFDLYEGNSSLGTEERRITTEAAADDPSTKAPDKGEYVEFQVVGVSDTSTYLVDRITLQDAAGHTSNEVAQEVSN
jgi:hypothetical protein